MMGKVEYANAKNRNSIKILTTFSDDSTNQMAVIQCIDRK